MFTLSSLFCCNLGTEYMDMILEHLMSKIADQSLAFLRKQMFQYKGRKGTKLHLLLKYEHILV